MPTHTRHLARACCITFALFVALEAPSALAQRAGAIRQQPGNAPALDLRTGAALNEAVAAVGANNYTDARAALGTLRLDRLSPYERGKTEQVLALIAVGERDYSEARRHLQNAIDSGGLSPEEAADARRQIAQFAADPSPAPLT